KKFSESAGALINMEDVDLSEEDDVPDYLKETNEKINEDEINVVNRDHPMASDMEDPLGDEIVSFLLGESSIDEFTDKAEKITEDYRNSKSAEGEYRGFTFLYILSLLFALECLIERRETMVQSKQQRYLFLAFCLLPTLVVFAVFTFYPLADGLYLSFFHWSGTGADKVFAGLDNYKQLIADDIIAKTIWHDYLLVVTKVFFIMILATYFAVAMTQLRIKEAPFYRIIFFFPNIMSVVIIGILWQFIFNPKAGLVNSGLEAIGLGHIALPWLGSTTWALPSLVLPSVWAGIGLF